MIKRRPGFTNPYKQVLGSYPGLALKAAREQTRVIPNLLAEGKSPREAKAEKAREEARKRRHLRRCRREIHRERGEQEAQNMAGNRGNPAPWVSVVRTIDTDRVYLEERIWRIC